MTFLSGTYIYAPLCLVHYKAHLANSVKNTLRFSAAHSLGTHSRSEAMTPVSGDSATILSVEEDITSPQSLLSTSIGNITEKINISLISQVFVMKLQLPLWCLPQSIQHFPTVPRKGPIHHQQNYLHLVRGARFISIALWFRCV